MRAARRLAKRNAEASNDLQAALTLLSANAFDPMLRTHKLKGELARNYACSVGYDLRILFSIVPTDAGETILLISVGTHDELY